MIAIVVTARHIERLMFYLIVFTVVILGNPTGAESKDVKLRWDASPTPSVTGYQVYTSLSPSISNESVMIDAGNVLTLTILGLADTNDHWFCVKAYDGIGNESVCSNIVKSSAVEVSQDVLPELDLDIRVDLLPQSL